MSLKDLTEFERQLSQIHLDLYHLMLGDSTWEEASICNQILKAFDEGWDRLKEIQDGKHS